MNDKVELSWLLQQIAAIQSDTEYLKEGLNQLAQMGEGDSGGMGSPGNLLGQAKANALRDVVRGREATNQQLLRLYERMYNDLFPRELIFHEPRARELLFREPLSRPADET